MRFLFYTHSLVSDWNHGNAHFLRGVMRALQERGHEALAAEPEESWSRTNLLAEQGQAAIDRFEAAFPGLRRLAYGGGFDHESLLGGFDVVVVHEWTQPALVARIGRARRSASFLLLFHDTHHRAVSATADIGGLALEEYDGVLAFGEALRQRYLAAGWGSQVVTWHEAADTALFRPLAGVAPERDLVWIGNWADGERSVELDEFLIRPAAELGLSGTVHGVRYPPVALAALARSGLGYGGWIANADVPRAFARSRATVHVPRRPYVEALPGIPTIRVFEALACGIPLVSAPWRDTEALFRPGRDFLVARDGREMVSCLKAVINEPALARSLSESGLESIRARHTCAHRVDELLALVRRMQSAAPHRTQREAAA